MSLLTPQQAMDLAAEHLRAGQFPAAAELYRQLLAIYPDHAEILDRLAFVAQHTGRFEEARSLFGRAIASEPQVARYHTHLGLLLAERQELEASAVAFETARQLDPADAEIPYYLGNTRTGQRQWDAAIAAFRAAVQIAPQHVRAWLNLSLALAASDRRAEAIAVCQEARRHCPGSSAIHVNLGAFLKDEDRLDEAVEAFRAALALAPDEPVALNNLAISLQGRGDLAAAIATLRRSLAIERSAIVHSNLIFTLHLDPATSSGAIREEERRWNEDHAVPLRPLRLPHRPDRSPDRRLRVGFLSPDLREHAVGRMLLPVFTALDPAAVEIFGYADPVEDAVSAGFRARADHWRSTTALTDAQLAAQIRADGIDLLVDLAQHTADNRLPALAYRPAPVQITWLGYPGATGLETIDYFFTDRYLRPPGEALEPGPEQPFYLDSYWSFAPPENSPPVNALPARTRGQVTFACSNQFGRINARMLDLWSRILQQVPGARLVLVSPEGSQREDLRAALGRLGVAANRVEFAAKVSRLEFLARHHAIDVALDTFPYNGPTTGLDALWMGVPLISLAGETAISRGGLSILSHLGLPELVAQRDEEYVRIAVALAHDLERLAALRGELRHRLQASLLMDFPRFARNLEAAWREMWRRWCRTA